MSPLYRYSFANAPAVRQIAPGETLTIEFPDSDGFGPDLQPLAASQFERASPNCGNPVFGPIVVDGAEPGDALLIHFQSIEPNRTIARTLLAPDHGFLPDALLKEPKPHHMYHWEISESVARVTNLLGSKAIAIPVHPFLGCIATASPCDPPLSSMLAGDHGGNMDHPDLIAGTSLCLPVSHTGGMLYVGDMHAAQGYGETAGGGLEISGKATLRVELCKQLKLTGPRYKTPQGIGCLGISDTMPNATRTALANMIHWLGEAGWNVSDAHMLVSQTCSFRMGAITDRYTAMSCFVGGESLDRTFFPWP